MKILIVGAGGYIGSGVARALIGAGHSVMGLARTRDGAGALARIGIEPVAGDVRDVPGLADAAGRADGVVFTPRVTFEEEFPTLKALIAAYEGSGRPLVYTSGTAVFAQGARDGEWLPDSFAEDDPFTPPPWPMLAPRLETEALVLNADPSLRGMIVRPPMVWGRGGSLLINSIFDSIRTTGAACYVGKGLHQLSNVHVDDLGEVHRLALERGRAGAAYHASSGETDFLTLAQWCAEVSGCGTRSVSFAEANRIWSVLGPSFASSNRSRATRSREDLGWAPTLFDVLQDIRDGGYRHALRP